LLQVGQLSTRSNEFRLRWAAHNVKAHVTGAKRFHHPVVGALTLTYEAFELAVDPGQRLNIYTAEPGSPSHEALNLLASWITTPFDANAGDD
jgi:MmyB-like transcription regulator ligand binding domain